MTLCSRSSLDLIHNKIFQTVIYSTSADWMFLALDFRWISMDSWPRSTAGRTSQAGPLLSSCCTNN
jgi:hypothetical protein